MRGEPQSGQAGIDAALYPRPGRGCWTLKAAPETIVEADFSVVKGKSRLYSSSDAKGMGIPPRSYLQFTCGLIRPINQCANARARTAHIAEVHALCAH